MADTTAKFSGKRILSAKSVAMVQIYELLFTAYGITSESKKLTCLIQGLNMDQQAKIQSVIENSTSIADPYT